MGRAWRSFCLLEAQLVSLIGGGHARSRFFFSSLKRRPKGLDDEGEEEKEKP